MHTNISENTLGVQLHFKSLIMNETQETTPKRLVVSNKQKKKKTDH